MRRAVRVLGILIALLLVVGLSLPFLISANRFKPVLQSKLSQALGRQVVIGDLHLSILSGAVAADRLEIAEDRDFGSAPFVQAKSLKVGVELWPLIFSKKLNVTGFSIDQPQVALLQSPAGTWNYSSLGTKATEAGPPAASDDSGEKNLDFSVKLISITGGRFSIGKTGPRQKPMVLENVNLTVRDFSPSAEFPFALDAAMAGGGDIKLTGKAGPLDSADLQFTPASIDLDIARLNLAAALAGTAPDIAGTASLRVKGTSRGGKLTAAGTLSAEGLKLAQNATPARRTVEFAFAIAHDLRKHAGALKRGDIRIGAASASLAGTYAGRDGATVLDAKFTGSQMPVPELAELLPALGIALPKGSKLEGGTATANLAVAGPLDSLVGDGSVSLDKTRLANFDLGAKMTLIEKLAGIKSDPNTDIETFGAKLRYTPKGTVIDNLRLVATGIGELSGSGAISPANALDFKMSATIQTTRSAVWSRTAVPFFVQGTAMDPIFKPDVRGLASAQAKSLLQSEAQKRLKGAAGEKAAGILENLLGGKKKEQAQPR